MITKYLTLISIIFLTLYQNTWPTRSVFRPSYKKLPQLVCYWKNTPKKNSPNLKYSLRDTHLEQDPVFNSFDYDHFMSSQLPKSNIKYRNSNHSVPSKILCYQMDILIKELKNNKKKFSHFKLLKNNDFNYRLCCGNIILKFKEHPFVAKVFMEKPQSFVKPFSKGWQPSGLYIVSGGMNRYLSGLKRIKNLNIVNKNIKNSSYWSKILKTPRKWFYLPKGTEWFCVEGHNIGPTKYNYMELPDTYIVIADAIDKEKELNIYNYNDRVLGIKISKFLGNRVDPHIDNFVIEKGSKNLVLIDTEHFSSIVGLKKQLQFDSYSSWYSQLAHKFIKDCWGRNKIIRKKIQKQPTKVILSC